MNLFLRENAAGTVGHGERVVSVGPRKNPDLYGEDRRSPCARSSTAVQRQTWTAIVRVKSSPGRRHCQRRKAGGRDSALTSSTFSSPMRSRSARADPATIWWRDAVASRSRMERAGTFGRHAAWTKLRDRALTSRPAVTMVSDFCGLMWPAFGQPMPLAPPKTFCRSRNRLRKHRQTAGRGRV